MFKLDKSKKDDSQMVLRIRAKIILVSDGSDKNLHFEKMTSMCNCIEMT